MDVTFKDGDSPEPSDRYYGPDVEINMHRNQLGFRDYNHNNSVSTSPETEFTFVDL